jgi:hypothetical protein
MANEFITFSCPACGIKLTVPGNLAGVSGPCPTCRTQIQAPIPSPPEVPKATPNAQIPAPVLDQPVPVPPERVDAPRLSQPAPSTAFSQPIPVSPPITAEVKQQPNPPILPSTLLSEPPPVPKLSLGEEPVEAQSPESSGPDETNGGHPNRSPGRNRLFLVLIPLLFVIAALAIGFGVMTLFKNLPSEIPKKSPGVQLMHSPKPGTTKFPDAASSQTAAPKPIKLEPSPPPSEGQPPVTPTEAAK